jgi:hypothetical protein
MEMLLFMTSEMGALFSVSAHPKPRNVTPVMLGGVIHSTLTTDRRWRCVEVSAVI